LSTRSALAVLASVSLVGSTACWEQIDGGQWFPQMKRQIAVQAFEDTGLAGHPQGLTPPEGTVPVGAADSVYGRSQEEADGMQNPAGADLRSLENGRDQYEVFCATCHGQTGLADGPVAKVFLGVLPLVGVVKARTDGHIFSTIGHGRRRMPSYQRIPEADRWDIVNYVRYLDQKGGRP
jgi:mono/diheme cytochrome c family protein